jgi:putative transposase
MAWKGTCAVGERIQLVELVRNRDVPVAEAARVFGVSRKTAHKWLARADAFGLENGLRDASRARHRQEQFEGPAVELLLELRRQHPTWGPRTLLYSVARKEPNLVLPAASTLGDILRRQGLVAPRKRKARPGTSPYLPGDSTPLEPNDRWTIDFKGQFRLLNGELCYPLTLRDAVSRAVLRIDAFECTRGGLVLPVLTTAFEEHGLPLELHSDTGSPFASNGLARLSTVSVFALKLGIRPVFSRPGKPQDNGGHERMHRDLKAETTRPPSRTVAEQQHRFDAFRTVFNEDRPHHALAGETPMSRWKPSPRKMPSSIPEPSYPKHWETRRVDRSACLYWHSRPVMVTKALMGEPLGLEPIDDGLWRIHFASLAIALLDERGATPQVIGVNRIGNAQAAA